jgi:hypothetical protein
MLFRLLDLTFCFPGDDALPAPLPLLDEALYDLVTQMAFKGLVVAE